MILATILLFSIFPTGVAPSQETPAGQSAPQADSATKPADATPAKTQDASPTPNAPASKPKVSTKAKTSAGSTHSKSAAHPPQKKTTTSNCVPAPAAGTGSAAANSDPSGSTKTGGTSTQTPSAASNCPPPKIIIQQGGTSDPSIQLAGGATGDQADQQRNTANQMLGATEKNLKKIEGQSLSQDQQNVVTQIRQFMEQSKNAVAAGDTERARTLAWKAQLLSEELANPQK